MSTDLQRNGYTLLPNVADDLGALRASFDGNARDVLDRPAVIGVLPLLRAVVEPHLPGAFCVRGLMFDKTPGRNWKVAWHRDETVAVRERVEADGFGPWSVKHGVPHVRPPRGGGVLAGMLTARLHVDACGPDSGPLRVRPGSHDGDGRGEVTVTAGVGDVLLMRPLLEHASSAATDPAHRRVLHLEFAAEELPGEMEWRWRR